MTNFLVMPDAEMVASKALRAGGFRAYSSIPKRPVWPLLTVQRLGGSPSVRRYLDQARIQVDVWGGAPGDDDRVSKGDILTIAQETRVLLLDLEGTTVSDNDVSAFISGTEDALGISWLPDPVSSRDRYIFSVYIYLRSMPVVSS